MPETYGKRQRSVVKAKKVAAREERRLQREQRRADRAAGVIESGAPIAANEEEDIPVQRRDEADSKTENETPPDENT